MCELPESHVNMFFFMQLCPQRDDKLNIEVIITEQKILEDRRPLDMFISRFPCSLFA